MMKSIKFLLILTMLGICAVIQAQGLAAALTGKQVASQKVKSQGTGQIFEVTNQWGQTLSYQVISETQKTVEVVYNKKLKYTNSHYSIPQFVNYDGATYSVVAIGKNAFQTARKTLKSITLPNSIKVIGDGAFEKCTILSQINFPEGLTVIGAYAFNHIEALAAVSLPSTLEVIGDKAFNGTAAFVNELKIPVAVNRIGSKAFFNDFYTLRLGYYVGTITELPVFINTGNCEAYGLSRASVEDYLKYRKPQQAVQQQIVYVNNTPQQEVQSAAVEDKVTTTPSSDVDIDIPSNPVKNELTFAVIFANENYQDEVKVEYALNDGEMFKQYCNQVLGLPEDNIHIRKDATLNNMRKEMEWITKVAQAYEGEARIIVYYAGHGIPDENSGSSYLLPIDGSGSSIATGYSLQKLYDELGELPAREVVVFMDACFSGSKRGEGMLASARGVAIKAKPQAPKGKMVVFSAAQGDETAYPFKEKGHGMFTYYLLKKLQESKGDVSLQELGDYVTSSVKRKSIVANGKSQTPSVVSSANLADDWKNLKLR